MDYGTKIACPKCNWEPDGGDYWACSSCSHVWDTFSTGAVCPACNSRHKYTQCIAHKGGCSQSSLHIDWYREIDRWLQEELEKIGHIIVIEA